MDIIKNEYLSLVGSEDFKDMYPTLTGDWEKDKKAFTKTYEENQKLLNGSLDLDDDLNEEIFDDTGSY